MTTPFEFAVEVLRWAWGIPVFALLWWLTRRLRHDPHELREPRWEGRALWFTLERLDRVSLGIIAGAGLLFWLGRNTVDPIPPDSVYHLLVARRITELGAIPWWDDWQFAPLGRPHLYPPLFHLLLAGAAKLAGGDFITGFRWVESLALPFTFFSTWYLARWLFDARRAFVALLIVGTDYSLVFTSVMGTPSVLSTSLFSILIVFFLSGRWLVATAIAIMIVYTHLGVPTIMFGALTIFCVFNRRYLPQLLAMAAITLVTGLPWYARLVIFRDWFAHPLELGVYGALPSEWIWFYKIAWLQFISISILVLMIRSFRGLRWGEPRNQILLAIIAASLPMLLNYGGRFYTHSLHIWAILAGGLFAQYLVAPVSRKRIIAFCLLALTPSAGIMGTGTPIGPGVYPMPSAWLLGPFIAAGGLRLVNDSQPPGYVTWAQTSAVGERVAALTEPDQIIYCEHDRDFALMVQWHAHRPIDTGAWEETQPGKQAMELIDWAGRNNPRACFVSRFNVGFPADMYVEQVGDLFIAIRMDKKDQKQLRKEIRKQEKAGRNVP
ncbi:MAG: hypothetical protein SGI88_12610 [Candidatus Hydrogenedentes bacterium]|nr:hypothetical protein [Candidatus Hydrogenedentota bacterium]